MLVVQAQCEDLTIVTADPATTACDVRTIDASDRQALTEDLIRSVPLVCAAPLLFRACQFPHSGPRTTDIPPRSRSRPAIRPFAATAAEPSGKAGHFDRFRRDTCRRGTSWARKWW